ncbi:winged helix-turn-helix domain-containing protein [candidate division KSB1 bacterium]
MKPDKANEISQNSVDKIDKLIHEPSRFLIMANLYVLKSADFLFLINQTGMTQGNLSSHLSKLENAGYIKIEKEFVGKRPHTILSITKEGRASFQEYRIKMKSFLDSIPE